MKITKIKTGTYRHFKGDRVKVIGTALHSETLEEFVVYRHTTGERKGEQYFWIRPTPMFLEKVERDGRKVKRFRLIRALARRSTRVVGNGTIRKPEQ